VRKIFVLLLVAAVAVPAWAQFVGLDQQHKPEDVGLTPTVGDREGVLAFEPVTTTPGDTIKTWSVFVRGARRIVWRVTGSDTTAAAPCSLVNVFVSNSTGPPASISSRNATTVGWTVNDYVSGGVVGLVNANGAAQDAAGQGGAQVEAICGGGVLRSSWDFSLLVLTRKSGAAGAFDSLRVTNWVQWD